MLKTSQTGHHFTPDSFTAAKGDIIGESWELRMPQKKKKNH
jgi:hypothetical protein